MWEARSIAEWNSWTILKARYCAQRPIRNNQLFHVLIVDFTLQKVSLRNWSNLAELVEYRMLTNLKCEKVRSIAEWNDLTILEVRHFARRPIRNNYLFHAFIVDFTLQTLSLRNWSTNCSILRSGYFIWVQNAFVKLGPAF